MPIGKHMKNDGLLIHPQQRIYDFLKERRLPKTAHQIRETMLNEGYSGSVITSSLSAMRHRDITKIKSKNNEPTYILSSFAIRLVTDKKFKTKEYLLKEYQLIHPADFVFDLLTEHLNGLTVGAIERALRDKGYEVRPFARLIHKNSTRGILVYLGCLPDVPGLAGVEDTFKCKLPPNKKRPNKPLPYIPYRADEITWYQLLDDQEEKPKKSYKYRGKVLYEGDLCSAKLIDDANIILGYLNSIAQS